MGPNPKKNEYIYKCFCFDVIIFGYAHSICQHANGPPVCWSTCVVITSIYCLLIYFSSGYNNEPPVHMLPLSCVLVNLFWQNHHGTLSRS